MTKDYDYIFAGGGLAGLTLLYYILEQPTLQDKKILVIDSVKKKGQNDRTWCFWEKEIGFYDELVSARWKKLRFQSPSVDRIFEMKEYEYKLIRSVDYYDFIYKNIADHDVDFINEEINSIKDENGLAVVETPKSKYSGQYVFNSTPLFNPTMSKNDTLLQHFEGWFIQTKTDVFDSSVGTLMDFTVSQKHGLTFMYVLPLKSNEALVEYTLFTPELLDKEEYKQNLKEYIRYNLQIDEYEIIHDEFGVIPMSMKKFSKTPTVGSNVINIGTAGGYTKASTGYTFKNTHKEVSRIAKQLAAGQSPVVTDSFRKKMFDWYDMTLLDVLLKEKVTGEKLFSSLFGKNNPERILAFLTNESNHLEEFKIRNSVPLWPFMVSGIKQLLKVK